jgi:hypothetical protein
MSERDDLTPEEKRALGALTAGPEPPPALEDAVVSRLAASGLIGKRRRPGMVWGLAAAAGLALFALGVAVGSRRAPESSAPKAPEMTRYVLFLYDAPDETAIAAAEMAARVTEYRDWAIGLRKAGSDITGEKLAPESLDLGAAGAPPGPLPLGGYFVFSAKDPAAALAIARSCPHVRHGGRAALRPIEET